MKQTLMHAACAALIAATMTGPAVAQDTMPATDETVTGSGENTGSAADSGGSADVMGMTRDRLAAVLQSGADLTAPLTGLTATTAITVTPVSQMEETAGASVGSMDDGQVPMTGGLTTVDTPASASASADASAGMSGGSPAGIGDGAATGSTATVSVSSGGARLGLDGAIDEAEDRLTLLRDRLRTEDRIMQALRDAGHEPDDVIGLSRDDEMLQIFVEDSDA